MAEETSSHVCVSVCVSVCKLSVSLYCFTLYRKSAYSVPGMNTDYLSFVKIVHSISEASTYLDIHLNLTFLKHSKQLLQHDGVWREMLNVWETLEPSMRTYNMTNAKVDCSNGK